MKTETKWPGPWIEKLGPTDRHGRCQYAIYGASDYHPGHPDGEHRTDVRGQVYYADAVANGHYRYATWPGMESARAMIAKAEGRA